MAGGGGEHQLAPRSIIANRAGLKGVGGGGVGGELGKQAPPGKDALFSFDQKNLDMFSLPAGGAVGGGARGLRGLAGTRKARPSKPLPSSSSAESAAPKGTEGATAAVAGAIAGSLGKTFPAPPVRPAAIPETPRKNNSVMNDVDGGGGGDNAGELPEVRWYGC